MHNNRYLCVTCSINPRGLIRECQHKRRSEFELPLKHLRSLNTAPKIRQRTNGLSPLAITADIIKLQTHTHMHINTHTHTCTHIYTHAHIHTHTHKHTYTHAHTYTHMHTHTHKHTYTHAHTYTHMHTHTYTHIHTNTHTYTHIHTHLYTYTLRSPWLRISLGTLNKRHRNHHNGIRTSDCFTSVKQHDP